MARIKRNRGLSYGTVDADVEAKLDAIVPGVLRRSSLKIRLSWAIEELHNRLRGRRGELVGSNGRRSRKESA